MAMVPSYIFIFMMSQTGDLVLPIPGIPHISPIGTTVSFWPALFISLALAAGTSACSPTSSSSGRSGRRRCWPRWLPPWA